MLIAVLNRQALQVLTASRIAEAGILLEHQHWTGAYYLTGLGVECALKACVARAVQQHDLPNKEFINRAYTHNLRALSELDAALWLALNNDISTDTALRENWLTVWQWKDEKRYEEVSELEARSLYSATTQPVSGILEWIRRRW